MSFSCENIRLFIISEQKKQAQWLENWIHGYPAVVAQTVDAQQDITDWQTHIQAAYQTIDEDEKIMLVAHDIGANAAVCWYYQTSILTHKRIAGMILISPNHQHNSCQHHTFQMTRFQHPTAVIMLPENDKQTLLWAEQQTKQWQAKLFIQQPTRNWSWGMQLMQEMLFNP